MRDGHVAALPAILPAKPKRLWRTPISGRGLAGLAATDKYVLAAGRELNDTNDVFRCLDAVTGAEVWTLRYPAPGSLDYGNSPRATPLVHEGRVYLYGAFGHLHCVELATGRVVWKRNVHADFDPSGKPTWGYCSSPLIAGGNLIVNPGGPEASLVALAPATGEVDWKSPGSAAGYGSLIVGRFGGREQIVGHDTDSLGGWDVATGKRLWRLDPPRKKDFNVPTPIAYRDGLIVTTENNGTRLYRFHADGTIDPTPTARNGDLAPDTHSPVVVGDRVFGVWNMLHCLDAKAGLKAVWESKDDAFDDYASLVAAGDRVMATTLKAELVLFDAKANDFKVLSRTTLIDGEAGVYSHPAIVGGRLYLRGNDAVWCFEIGGER